MATKKTSSSLAAVIHAFCYTLPFLFLTQNFVSLGLIFGSHFLIDRYRLAKYLVYAKNFVSPRSEWLSWADCKATGYSSEKPAFMSIWLLIIADNILHILCNGLALSF